MIPCALNITTATTTPATNTNAHSQNNQHNHVLCRAFLFCALNHESLPHALAPPVTVVQVRNCAPGRPDSERQDGDLKLMFRREVEGRFECEVVGRRGCVDLVDMDLRSLDGGG
jgi:hypothetical protein